MILHQHLVSKRKEDELIKKEEKKRPKEREMRRQRFYSMSHFYRNGRGFQKDRINQHHCMTSQGVHGERKMMDQAIS